jgi:hypothetical protein
MDDSPATFAATKSSSEEDLLLDRPIVVGYAFGPKKMSTMGVVMAEASKTKLTASIYNSPYNASTKDLVTDDCTRITDIRAIVTPELQDDHEEEEEEEYRAMTHFLHEHEEDDEEDPADSHHRNATATMHNSNSSLQNSSSQSKVVFSMETDGYSSRETSSSLANIVRHFQSSCSDSESTGTCTASASTSNHTYNTDTRTTTTSSHCSLPRQLQTLATLTSHQSVIRVSFVPLDLDQPLQDQHGGKIDIILHKLTEDILCRSQLLGLSGSNDDATSTSDPDSNSKTTKPLSPSDHAAIRRVQRLCEFRAEQPHCSLVDDPDCVASVMSRSSIAQKLHECLQNVITQSGMQVSSPKYSVVTTRVCDNDDEHDEIGMNNTTTAQHIEQQLANLSYPIIVKPLIAAGTKASHAMAVLMDPSGLPKVVSKAPCLCQEFSNHDTILYKVYVLGHYVSVHKRRSLPNLPCSSEAKSRYDYVEFDSHRPYPRLSDFGYD